MIKNDVHVTKEINKSSIQLTSPVLFLSEALCTGLSWKALLITC
jgi:hypothetical protein